MRRLLLCLIPLLASVLAGHAATVNTTPSQGLASALSQLRGGDTLVVGCGTYNEVVNAGTIPSGSASAPTILRAAQKRCAIVQPAFGTSRLLSIGENGARQQFITIDGLVFDGSSTGSSIAAVVIEGAAGSSDITFENNEIRNLKGNPSGMSTAFAIMYGTTPNTVIRGTAIHDIGLGDTTQSDGWGYGIYLSGKQLTFENNELYNISGFAVHGFNQNNPDISDNIVRNNYMHDTGGALLLCHSRNQIYNNVLARMSTGPACQANSAQCGGILLGGSCTGTPSTNNQVYNNTIVGSRGECIRNSFSGGTSTSGNVIRNNICWQNSQDVVTNSGGNTVDHNLLGQDPKFVQTITTASPATAFQLQQGSPAINAGVVTPAITTDMGGQARSQGGQQDLGAWEYGGGSVVPPEPQPGAAPIAWWKFDEGQGQRAADASGNGHTLTWTTNPGPAWATALQCDGTNNGASTAAGDVIPITRAYTWAMWFASRVRPSLGGSDQQIFYKGEQFGFFWSSNDNCCVTGASHRLAGGGYIESPRITQALTAGQVYHIAGTWDGQTVRLYLDGEEQASRAAPSIFAQGAGLQVCNPSSSPVVGSLGDLKFWDRALTAAEIRAEAATPPR